MKKLIFCMLTLLLFSKTEAQNDSISSNNTFKYYPNYNNSRDYWKTVTFKIGGGAYLPQGKLKNLFNNSPLFELSLDFPVTDNKSLELALQFILPSQSEAFYFGQDANVETEVALVFNPMLRFNKKVSVTSSSNVVIGLGVGASVLGLNNNIAASGEDEKNEITTFMVAPNLNYVKIFKNKEELTFSLALNYAPYKIKGNSNQNIGSLAFTPRIMYSF